MGGYSVLLFGSYIGVILALSRNDFVLLFKIPRCWSFLVGFGLLDLIRDTHARLPLRHLDELVNFGEHQHASGHPAQLT
jgi:hypothetical protein